MANEFDALVSLLALANAGRGASGGNTVNTDGGTTITEGGGGTSYSEGYSSPGDTTALQALLGELSGANYEQVLQSIFAQAGGKIPGFMNALQNSVGARSGSNSAVQAMLQKLLTETTLQGQAQIADLGLRNASTRAQIGANIAQATKGTHQYQTTVQEANPQIVTRSPSTQVTAPVKAPYGIGELAGMLGLLSAGKGIWGEFNKSGKGSISSDPTGTGTGSSITSDGSYSLNGGEITSDPWGLANSYMTDNQLFPFSTEPNFITDYGMSPMAQDMGFSQFISDPVYDFSNLDLGGYGGFNFDDSLSSFDSGTFVPEIPDWTAADQWWL